MPTLLYTFIKGILFGITIAALPGPIFFLIIQRTLATGTAAGLASGLGAIAADAVYAFIAVIGLSFVTTLLLAYKTWLAVIGGLFLLYLGISAYRQKVTATAVEIEETSLFGDFLSTFFLTLTNPVTIISYGIIFAGIGLSPSQLDLIVMVTGVTLGAAIVVACLVGFFGYFRHKLSPAIINGFNKFGSVLLLLFGVATLASAFLK